MHFEFEPAQDQWLEREKNTNEWTLSAQCRKE